MQQLPLLWAALFLRGLHCLFVERAEPNGVGLHTLLHFWIGFRVGKYANVYETAWLLAVRSFLFAVIRFLNAVANFLLAVKSFLNAVANFLLAVRSFLNAVANFPFEVA